MRWQGREQSQNVEDRRGMTPAKAIGGGGLGLVLIYLVASFLGADVSQLMRLFGPALQQQAPAAPGKKGEVGVNDQSREFISVVLRDTETVWSRLFEQGVRGGKYIPPKLVIFEQQVRSACGMAPAAVGPFYCPGDQQVYIAPSFFDDLARRHNAPGDFARAYVIAHEVAHHVQYLLGFSDKVNQVRARGNELETNRASVRLELQADYLAGVWAHYAHKEYNILEPGDIQTAINAANQIGDDTLQKQSQGYVVPDRFTHGTSEQRMRWFKKGIATGSLDGCQELFAIPYEQL